MNHYTKISIMLTMCLTALYAQTDDQKVNLRSVVTTASGEGKNQIAAPASVSVVGKEELEKKPYRDLGEAIKEVPGVSLDETSNKLGASAISIRGMPAGYTLFLVDDLRQNPSGDVATANLGVGVYNTFIPPLSAIERIEVIRGPMSTLWGSDAIGGVVNVITKPVTKTWTGSFQTQVIIPESSKFGNTYQNSLYLTGPLTDKLGLTLRMRQIDREASQRPTNDRGDIVTSFFGTKYQLYNIGSRLNFMPNKNNLYYADIDYTYSKYDNRNNEVGTVGVNQVTGRGGYEKWVGVNKLIVSAAHQGTYNFGNWKNSIQFLRTENTGRLVAGKTDSPNLGKNRGIASNDIIVDSRALFYLGDRNNLNIGAEYRNEHYHDLAATPADHDRNTLALFAEDEWNILDPLTFTFGARYNYNDKFGSNVSPRAYLVYMLTNNWSLKGGVSTGYKAPYANQLIDAVYGYGSQGTLAFLGNPNLKAESSINYEIGTVFDNQYLDFSLTFFRSNFKDKIDSRGVSKSESQTCNLYGGSGGRNGTDCNVAYNADSAYSQGIEASFGIKPIYGVSFDVSYTFIQTKITSGEKKGNPLSTTPKHNLFSKISYQYKHFSTYVQGQYKAGIVNTSALGNSTNAQLIRDKLDGIYYKPSFVLNLGVGYKLTDNLRLNAGVYNLLDTNFADFRYITGSGNNITNINYYGPVIQEGRRYWATLSYDF